MKSKKKSYGVMATESAKHHIKNLIGAFLFLGISLSLVMFILLPESLNLVKGVTEWSLLLESLLIIIFLIVFPLFLVVQALAHYQSARALEMKGKLTKGAIIEKWVDVSEGEPIYHVLYKYRRSIKALQIVSASVFQKLQCDQNIDVLHLENSPHISRLDFN